MIDIDEKKRAEHVKNILKSKINENTEIIDEKNNEIKIAFEEYYEDHSPVSKDYGDKLNMMSTINNANAINKIASRQLQRYKMMVDKPYFGRIDFKNSWGELPYYFGIESLLENNEVIVNDWRSPIANLYYENVEGDASYVSPGGEIKGSITLKRQYKFEQGVLMHYVDMGMNISDELLIDVLGKNNDVIMKNIVSTIQKEQNSAIRYIGDNDLLVLGVAGSGKTSIALHRIAYLVYKDSVKYDASKVCFITPNEIFYKYIENVLPELGEDNVVNLTLNEIARTIMKSELYKYKIRVENKIDYLEKVINGKKEVDFDDMFDKLNAFLSSKMQSLFNDKLGLRIGTLTFSSEIFKELYFNKFKRRDYYKRRRLIMEFLKDRVSNVKKVTKSVIEVIEAFVDKLLPPVNYFEVYDEFLKSIGYSDSVFKGKVLGYEHIYALCYVKIFFKECKLFDKFNHLLIDEYQDLNVIERTVVDRIFACNKTLVGDINQKLFVQDYELIKDNIKVVELTNSYRSTIQIFDFLASIIDSEGINRVQREGEEVKFELFDKEKDEINYLKKSIREYKGKSMAIVCKSKKMAARLYEQLKDFDNVCLLDYKGKNVKRGIVIASVSLVKGLEFDKVIVYEASDNNYYSEIDRNYLYIACSRAINSLEVLSSFDFSKYIDKKYIK